MKSHSLNVYGVPVFSTRTNRLEVNLEKVEVEVAKIAQLRITAGNNPFKRLYVLLRRRTTFLGTPLALWGFLALLGFLSAMTLYVPPFSPLRRQCCRSRVHHESLLLMVC
jgi:hypothetical protein